MHNSLRRVTLSLGASMLGLACGSPAPPETGAGSDTGDASTSGDTTGEPPAEVTSTGIADSTGADGSSDDTGADLCPAGAPGWQWIEQNGNEDGNETYSWVGVHDGGVVVVSDHEGDPFTHMLRRYDISGALQWEQPSSTASQVEDLRVLPDGDAVVCGRVVSPFPGMWLARHDSMGNERWSVDQPDLYSRSVDLTASGNIVVGGRLDAMAGPSGIPALLRFDGMGNLLETWTAELPVTFGIDNMIAVGEEVVMLSESGNNGFWLGRLDASNQLLWSDVHLDTDAVVRGIAVAVDPASGDIIVVGMREPSSEWSDLAAWRFTADGSELWSVSYDLGGNGEEAYAVRIAPSGNLVLAGGIGQADLYQPLVAALDPGGGLLWWTSLEGGSDSVYANDLELDDCGGIYVSGWGRWDATYDGWVGRYVPPEGL